MARSLRVAVVHDYLTQRGGAERVVLAMMRAFPGARLITSVYDPGGTFPEFRDLEVETTALNRVPAFRRDPRLALPLLPAAFSRLDLEDVDVVLASSSGWAHGAHTSAPRVVYCYNPPRWLYQRDDYVGAYPRPVRLAFALLRRPLESWDRRAAGTADRYLTSSSVVQARIRRAYGIDAALAPPPVTLLRETGQSPVPGVAPGYFLVVGRARGYKNVEVVVEAFRQLPDQRLVVVGSDPDPTWPVNVTTLSGLSDDQMRWVYAGCRAVVAASHEDFGLTPLEGNAFGKPALVLRAGGFLDTLDEGVTGLYIEALDPAAVRDAVRASLEREFDPVLIEKHADRYSEEAFAATLRREVTAAAASGRARPSGRRSPRR